VTLSAPGDQLLAGRAADPNARGNGAPVRPGGRVVDRWIAGREYLRGSQADLGRLARVNRPGRCGHLLRCAGGRPHSAETEARHDDGETALEASRETSMSAKRGRYPLRSQSRRHLRSLARDCRTEQAKSYFQATGWRNLPQACRRLAWRSLVGEPKASELSAGRDTELHEDVAQVVVDRPLRQEHLRGDLRVGKPFGDAFAVGCCGAPWTDGVKRMSAGLARARVAALTPPFASPRPAPRSGGCGPGSVR